MPIDFAAVATRYDPLLTAQTRAMIPVLLRLAETVRRLAVLSERAGTATRAYPVLRYEAGAVAVHLAGGPLDATGPLPGPPSADPLAQIPAMVAQERVIPGAVALLLEVVAPVADSLDRFADASPAVFGDRRLADVFGLANLAFAVLLEDRERLRGLKLQLGALLEFRSRPASVPGAPEAPGPPASSASSAPPGGPDALAVTLESAAMSVFDLLLLLPVAGRVLDAAAREAAAYGRRLVLLRLGEVERAVTGLRVAVLEGFIAGAGLLTLARQWLHAARAVAGLDVLILRFALPWWLGRLLDGVTAFAGSLTQWGRWVTELVEAVRATVDAVMGFDLGKAVFGPMTEGLRAVPGLGGRVPDPPSLTVDELIGIVTGQAATGVRDRVVGFLLAVRGVLWLVRATDRAAKVGALAELLGIVLTPTRFTLPPDVLPAGPPAGFPDVYTAFFGGGRREDLLAAVDRLGTEARAGVRGVLTAGSALVSELGRTASAPVELAGDPAALRRAAERAAGFAEQVFGAEADRAAEASARSRALTPFERWQVSGGFALAGAAVDVYIGEMRRFWGPGREVRRGGAPVAHPTSPHILARHGRLGAVRLPRLTVRAAGRVPDEALAAEVSARFRENVAAAYLSGLREFRRLGGHPPKGDRGGR
ncbi:hypothetical protein [Planobispora rosea]|uniref:hypothetical protein n=1 Tax=Planobispora rosea TaxID=35762 RepID=UPI00083A3265|nr:hypothetical protein [Planobispora rosea]